MDKEKEFEEMIEKDPQLKRNRDFFQELDKKAMEEAENLSLKYVKEIMENPGEMSTTLAMLSVAKTLTFLCSYLYDKEEDFISAVDRARKCVAEELVPKLLNPQPCGHCDECQNGNPEGCKYPKVRGNYIESRFIPIAAGMLIEDDLFNKIIYQEPMDEDGKENEDGKRTDKDGHNVPDEGDGQPA